jgi:hypothetical protein
MVKENTPRTSTIDIFIAMVYFTQKQNLCKLWQCYNVTISMGWKDEHKSCPQEKNSKDIVGVVH